jgi:hypothetical protein
VRRSFLSLLAVGLVVPPLMGEPRQFTDDFTTVTTYDSNSLTAPCYVSGAPSTKYTVFEAIQGGYYNERMVSGGGKLLFSNRSVVAMPQGRFELTVIGVLDIGQGCPDNPDPSPGASLITSEPFSSPNVCMYGGFSYRPVELLRAEGTIWGSDSRPGVANVDDDQDGATDEEDENVFRAPCKTTSRYGPPFPGGLDARPGVAGVDDDGDGTIDDIGETAWPGSDDGDDGYYKIGKGPAMRGNFSQTSMILIWISPTALQGSLFGLYEVNNGVWQRLERSNEILAGFYQPRTRYNYVFCGAASCYGALLWVGADMSNPVETVGPFMSSDHNPAAGHDICGFYNLTAYDSGENNRVYMRNQAHMGNRNFGDSFWVVSGSPAQYYPSPSPDLDGDKDVDGFDFLTFSNCYNGSNKPPLAACANGRADLDRDGDVDGFDFLTFSNCYNGSNKKPLAACFPPNLTTCGT